MIDEYIYKEMILELSRNPMNKKRVDNATHRAPGVNPSCGDSLEIAMVVEDDVIVDVGFEGKGCAISQAAASLITQEIKGKSITQAKEMTDTDMYELLGVPISINRQKCALLALHTIHQALTN